MHTCDHRRSDDNVKLIEQHRRFESKAEYEAFIEHLRTTTAAHFVPIRGSKQHVEYDLQTLDYSRNSTTRRLTTDAPPTVQSVRVSAKLNVISTSLFYRVCLH